MTSTGRRLAAAMLALSVTSVLGGPAWAEDQVPDSGEIKWAPNELTPLPEPTPVIAAAECTWQRLTWVNEQLTGEPIDGGVNYRWTGSGHTSVPRNCATHVAVHARITNFAPAAQAEQRKQGTTATRIEPMDESHYRTAARTTAEVATLEFWLGDRNFHSARGPATVYVQVWGSYLSKDSRQWLPMRCRERVYRVQAAPSPAPPLIEEMSYGECTAA